MVKIDDHLAEIRRCEDLLKHPKHQQQKHELQRRLHRLRREYRQAKIYLAESKK